MSRKRRHTKSRRASASPAEALRRVAFDEEQRARADASSGVRAQYLPGSGGVHALQHAFAREHGLTADELRLGLREIDAWEARAKKRTEVAVFAALMLVALVVTLENREAWPTILRGLPSYVLDEWPFLILYGFLGWMIVVPVVVAGVERWLWSPATHGLRATARRYQPWAHRRIEAEAQAAADEAARRLHEEARLRAEEARRREQAREAAYRESLRLRRVTATQSAAGSRSALPTDHEGRPALGAGYIYVMSNVTMPGLVKIGRTRDTPEDRARSLRGTGVAGRFVVERAWIVRDAVASEKEAHALLKAYRVSRDREFFRLAPKEAIAAIEREFGVLDQGKPTSANGSDRATADVGRHQPSASAEVRPGAQRDGDSSRRPVAAGTGGTRVVRFRCRSCSYEAEVRLPASARWVACGQCHLRQDIPPSV